MGSDLKKIAIMQPYLFPYIGYFQLVNAVDTFVFYDDVNFIKGGWINRNNILINGKRKLITVPCIKPSQNKLINQVYLDPNKKTVNSILKSIDLAYKKAPYYSDVFPLIYNFLSAYDKPTVSELAIDSVLLVVDYLNLKSNFKKSSKDYSDSSRLKKDNRLIEISKTAGASIYINPIGGVELYSKKRFEEEGITLNFIESGLINYTQYKNEFVPNLSIIDVMMFNSPQQIKEMLNQYILI